MKRAVKQMLPVYVLSFLANVVSAIVILRYGMSYSGQWEFFYKRVIFVIFFSCDLIIDLRMGDTKTKKDRKRRINNRKKISIKNKECKYD